MELSVRKLRVATALAEHLPSSVARAAVHAASKAFAHRSPAERVVIERYLRRIYGLPLDGLLPDPAVRTAQFPKDAPITEAQLDEKVEAVFQSFGRYWLDALRLPSLSMDELDRTFTYEGLEHLILPAQNGQGVIAAIPHFGSWESASRWLVLTHNIDVAAAVEQLEPPELYEWFLTYRRDLLGLNVIPVSPTAAVELAGALSAGSVLCLLSDRDLTGDGIAVEFFGERTTLPGGPALLALRSGAPLVPVAVFVDGNNHHAVVLPPLDTERRGRLRADVQRVTQDVAHALETLICRDPTQWHVLQPNWPSDFAALGLSMPAWVQTENEKGGADA
ncbi:MAG: phosphatidylinositol mannoside acyltransferase [Actinomycetes bacterium]